MIFETLYHAADARHIIFTTFFDIPVASALCRFYNQEIVEQMAVKSGLRDRWVMDGESEGRASR